MNPADGEATKIEPRVDGLAGISLQSKTEEDLHSSGLEDLLRLRPQQKPAEDLQSLIAKVDRHLDHETSERKAIYDRLVAIENAMKKRGSRRFGRYLVAILIGVAATLAWQSYGESAKQIIATRAPELGWSPEAKQMIATSIQ